MYCNTYESIAIICVAFKILYYDLKLMYAIGSNTLELEVGRMTKEEDVNGECDIIMSGVLDRLCCNISLIKSKLKPKDANVWRKRWVVLRSDNCLLWYRTENVSFFKPFI